MADESSQQSTHRVARCVEVALLFVTGAGIAALIVAWTQMESLLSPGESLALVGARLMRGIFSLVVPLVILLFLSNLRVKIVALLNEQNANLSTIQSAKYMWYLVMMSIVIILTMDAIVIVASFQDIDFN